MSNINISVTEQDPINVSIASPEVQNVDISAQSISATVTDGDKGDIVVTGNGTVWTLDPNALSTRVPYTGATSDVNLGEFGIQLGNLEFDTSPTNAPTGAGSMVWNDTEGTLDLMLKGGSVNLPIGQKQVIRAVNGTGGNLTRAQYRAVKITGAQGQRLQVSLARADDDLNSKDTIGIVGEDISNNQTGFIVSSGTIENINTTGNLQGETWTDGDTLYLSGTTFGVITNIKPTAPTHTVILGFVVYAHQNNGKIYVKVDNGYELDELHNVNVSTAASGDYLRYNGTTWVDATISAADLPSAIDASKIGSGLVSNTEFGYLDGVTSAIQTQLNAKQATLTNPVTGTGVSGQVSFFNGTSTVTGDNGLFWDNTNKRLGVNTSSTDGRLHVVGPSSGNNPALLIQGASTLPLEFYDTSAGTNSKRWQFNTNSNIFFFRALSDDRSSFTNSFGVFRAGNVTFGGLTDAGYQVDIQGTLRNTTSAYFATSSGNVGVGTVSPASKLDVYATRTSSTNVTALTLSDNVTGTQTDGVYKSIRSRSNGSASVSEIRFLETDGTNNNTSIAFATQSSANGLTEQLRINQWGNLLLGTTLFGSSATKTFVIGSGTAPTTSPADAFQLYSADITAGNAAPHFRTEGGAVVKKNATNPKSATMEAKAPSSTGIGKWAGQP